MASTTKKAVPQNTYRWAGQRGRMELVNRSVRTREVELDMTVFGNDGTGVTIRTPLLRQPLSLKLDHRGHSLRRALVLPPGRYPVDFVSNADLQTPPDDFRDLAFFVQNFSVNPLSPQ